MAPAAADLHAGGLHESEEAEERVGRPEAGNGGVGKSLAEPRNRVPEFAEPSEAEPIQNRAIQNAAGHLETGVGERSACGKNK